MAQIIENSKGFKIISTSMSEALNFGGLAICDTCNQASFKGYIVCVLNRWCCENCYEEWNDRAIYYTEDSDFESMKFEYFKKLLNIN